MKARTNEKHVRSNAKMLKMESLQRKSKYVAMSLSQPTTLLLQ